MGRGEHPHRMRRKGSLTSTGNRVSLFRAATMILLQLGVARSKMLKVATGVVPPAVAITPGVQDMLEHHDPNGKLDGDSGNHVPSPTLHCSYKTFVVNGEQMQTQHICLVPDYGGGGEVAEGRASSTPQQLNLEDPSTFGANLLPQSRSNVDPSFGVHLQTQGVELLRGTKEN